MTPVRGVTWALFVFEARRLARHPLVWGMTGLVLALQLHLSRGGQPHLGVDPVNATGLSTCLAGAVLVVASMAASRDTRHGMPESLAGLPGRAEHRTRAVLLATALVSGSAAVVAVGGYLVIRLLGGPAAGRFDIWEPLTAVAAAVFAATLGVAVGRWARWLIAGPVVVAVLGYLIFQNPTNGRLGWLLPVMQVYQADWPDRPSGIHLLYVVALAACWAAVALLRHRARTGRVVAAVAALAVAVPAGSAAAAEPPGARPGAGPLTMDDVDPRVRERYFGPGAHRCADRHGITYCAYEGYEAWIPLWEQAVRPAVDVLPAALRARVPRVEQRSSTWFFGSGSDVIRAPMTWGHPDQRALMAQDVAIWATGLGRSPAGGRNGCDGGGQARTVVALWIMGQVAPPEPPRVYHVDENFGRRYLVTWGAAEVAYAERLLATPGAAERVRAAWPVLMDPATTIDQGLPLLGLTRTRDTKPGRTPCR
ncbi:hypothetical protein [Nonomuraea aridisoli]|uniref:Uncharacterized protein n=1 Tax=Nonomuraea aridisoli TaxID=2070368 RepID=A0A2W2E583_9ACTN|nr:hypothetical protein [Nonomuraea aridisoli]PZG11779.1 hypothetical protein C1J01_34255 [Nonomuraea aridisoli]